MATSRFERSVTYGPGNTGARRLPAKVVRSARLATAEFSINQHHAVPPPRASCLAMLALGADLEQIRNGLSLKGNTPKVYASHAASRLGAHGLRQAVHHAFGTPSRGEFDEPLFIISRQAYLIGHTEQVLDENLDMLALAAHGLTNKEIAGKLGRSERSVDWQASDIRYALDLPHDATVIMLARLSGYSLELNEPGSAPSFTA